MKNLVITNRALDVLQRFTKYVDKITSDKGCWLWTGAKNKEGYGYFNIGGTQYRAHRISWVISIGKISENKLIRHGCDNPSCVNPDHLEEGTPKDNSRDMVDRNRQSSGDTHYAKLYPEKLCRGERHSARLYPEKVARGEKHSNAKFTEKQIIEIRKGYSTGDYTQQYLATKFNVSPSTISRIVINKTWRHVGDKIDE